MFNEKVIKALDEYFDLDFDISAEKVEEKHERFAGMYVQYEIYKNSKTAVIKYVDEFEQHGEYSKTMYNRLGCFLPMVGYEFNKENFQVMLILHEFGHIDYMSKMNYYDSHGLAYAIESHIENLINISFTKNDIDEFLEDGVDIPYMLKGTEMYADSFALRNYIPVMKYLKEKNIF